jgi:TonB family protein
LRELVKMGKIRRNPILSLPFLLAAIISCILLLDIVRAETALTRKAQTRVFNFRENDTGFSGYRSFDWDMALPRQEPFTLLYRPPQKTDAAPSPSPPEQSNVMGKDMARPETETGETDTPKAEENSSGKLTGFDAPDESAVAAAFREKIMSRLVYPPLARRKNLTGTVELTVRLDAAGNSLEITVHKTSGHTILDQAAVELVRDVLPFEHGLSGPLTLEVPITYTLTEGGR